MFRKLFAPALTLVNDRVVAAVAAELTACVRLEVTAAAVGRLPSTSLPAVVALPIIVRLPPPTFAVPKVIPAVFLMRSLIATLELSIVSEAPAAIVMLVMFGREPLSFSTTAPWLIVSEPEIGLAA